MALLSLVIGFMCACDHRGTLLAPAEEPMVMVVLSIAPPHATTESLPAVVARASARVENSLRPAERFEMRRSSDGRLFAWRAAASVNVIFPYRPGNYELADSSTGVGLGRADLAPGERYELVVETQGVRVTGTVTMPHRPVLWLRRGASRDTIVWRHVQGASAYRTPDGLVVTDTVWVATRQAGRDQYSIAALDPQLASYLQSPRLTQSGIVGALGLFGAEISATVLASDSL